MADFYTASKACQVLGIPSYQFFRMVERGRIERVPRPTGKRGAYRKEQIDQLAREIREMNVISA